MLNISLQNEYVFTIFGLNISNTFFTAVIVTLLLSALAYYCFRNLPKKNFVVEAFRVVVYEILTFIDSVTGDRELSKRILPLVGTLFLFIVSANLIALIPGFLGSFYVMRSGGEVPLLRSPNSDLTITSALALFTVVAMQIFSVRAHGVLGYIKRFIDLSGPIKLFTGFFELLSEITRIISFSFRLFGNIFAGEILLLVIAFLVPYIIPVPFMIMEVFVGVIQAFVFAMLSITFTKIDTNSSGTAKGGVL
ncbi:F0F1 ATP synthase subunit A [candidate division WWE3 bacterium]|uniref:ATP synthase subunit a n=1 Tax=candidate division WWE3 bacterium TaxID=2053526 RepID=A0A955RRT3_UNCKA|nr:F0F1 ATP synthase subunit A [candidate division WWE3 bacterium]